MGSVEINGPLLQRAVVMLHHSVAAQVDVEGFVKGSAQGTPLNVAPARDRRLHFFNWAACVVQICSVDVPHDFFTHQMYT